MIYIGTTDFLKVRCGSTQATTMTTGPNDARRVGWALGEFFSIFFFSFIYYLKMYLGDPGQSETMGPKRRLHCRLGPGIITLPVQVTTPTTTSPHLDGLAMRG